MKVTFAQVKRLEGLIHSLRQARDRKRRGFTIHADELDPLIEALTPAITLMDERRLDDHSSED
jgi:hypothetical protein